MLIVQKYLNMMPRKGCIKDVTAQLATSCLKVTQLFRFYLTVVLSPCKISKIISKFVA